MLTIVDEKPDWQIRDEYIAAWNRRVQAGTRLMSFVATILNGPRAAEKAPE